MRRTSKFFAAIAAVALLGYAPVASAGTVFTIDNSQSTITLGANIGGTTVLLEQFAGSLTTGVFGTIDTNFSPYSSIEFLGGGTIGFDQQGSNVEPGTWVPDDPMDPYGPGHFSGTDAPGQFGGTVNVLGGLVSGPAAGRNLTGEATSLMSIMVDGAGNFDSTQLIMGLVSNMSGDSVLDYDIGGAITAVGETSISNNSANDQDGGGTVTVSGTTATLTIPLHVEIPIDLSGTTITGTLDGNIVATATVVPEPTTIAMLSMGLVGLVAVGYRRRRKAA
jgi:hypothetical protein